MRAKQSEILDTIKSKGLTYQQKHHNLANIAERLVDPIELLNYTSEEMEVIENNMICDLNEGYGVYRPRYIVPDYSVFIKEGCKFLDLNPPTDIDELLDGLLILYSNVPSITSFPVFIGELDQLIDPFITNEDEDYIKIKRFLNHIDKTIPDSFCHANIGPKASKAGELILKAVIELQNPTPNMTIKYNKNITNREFAKLAAKACLVASKPSFSNDDYYIKDVGEHGIASCYNALPMAGGAYTLLRLRLGTIAKSCSSKEELINEALPNLTNHMLSMIDKRIKFIVEESNFFETSFLVEEGFIKKDNFTAMPAIVGLAEAVNHVLKLEDKDERFGQSEYGDEIAHEILTAIEKIVNNHEAVYCERTNNRYLFHAQVGASLDNSDKENTPAHRIPVGDEPILPLHLTQSAQFHKYFPSGTGDLFAFDQTYLNNLDAVLDIIEGAFNKGYRYITTYLQNSDLIRVTGYLVKRSEVEKARREEIVLRNTAMLGMGTDDNAHVFSRRTRD
ncbi:YjjI family glycine radical enzyme [Alkaliphilus sp. MSJ-5]|uniref:YjjI family glycine radical enzyme n=1 Tax=Alkaliphilus flagellatus TaxID=2841507 RepID=A0ABS6FZR0_9FIRM|nr:YjjI family glycine radical enzyme [Alkaliphilus flagellatus]MBU5675439.1 YjjI family glycine radical enzyme [Alkaliphilus flagellatus]